MRLHTLDVQRALVVTLQEGSVLDEFGNKAAAGASYTIEYTTVIPGVILALVSSGAIATGLVGATGVAHRAYTTYQMYRCPSISRTTISRTLDNPDDFRATDPPYSTEIALFNPDSR